MAYGLTALAQWFAHGFDSVIDVRSPAEYAEDHLPGAISLPVLSNEERARVGTIYKQQSPFAARKIGGAIVARAVAAHLDGPLAGMGGGWRPLVYCWRGGQRSGSFATILRAVGWRVETLEGGYRAWRRLVAEALYDAVWPVPAVVLDGLTGTAKTDLLSRLAARGVQVLDLEGLANHRGSLFGARAGGQPSQRAFEGRLAMAMVALDPARPVVVEAESAAIGDVRIPPALWAAMRAAPRVAVSAPLEARAAYLARAYGDLTLDPLALHAAIDRLRPMQPRERIEAWHALANAAEFAALAAALMEHHYDPRYAKSRARHGDPVRTVVAADLSGPALDLLADRVAAAIADVSR
ncbi:MAG: tRNA 2-selenouridine(34) synthase MnmH [Gemmobacter sp.]